MAKTRIPFNRARAQSPFLFHETFSLKDAWRGFAASKANMTYFCKPSLIRELLWAEAGYMSFQNSLVEENRGLF